MGGDAKFGTTTNYWYVLEWSLARTGLWELGGLLYANANYRLLLWFFITNLLGRTLSQTFPGMIFLAEIISESNGVHYTKGGPLTTIIFPPIDFSSVDPAKVEKQRNKELNNGRLAMIAIMSFCAEANIPGSVPLLTGNPMF
jgi:Chlorophyll A-B binding protein